jgi:cardiolipin synthase
MQKAGIKVFGFHSEKEIKNKFQINFRNHRKIVVVDGNEAWIGGHNIGDEYLSKNNTFGHWRDTHMKISGPTVIPIQITFIEDWYWATGNFLSNLYWKPPIFKENNKKILILPSSPADMVETASLMFIEAINSATEYVWISSPYFVPDIAVIKALQLAGLRGIDVRILIPKKADHILVYLAAFTYFKSIGETGVKFFRYNHGFLHQKAMIIDSSHVTIGTANLDNRSFRLNFEMSALISDETFAKEVKQMFENDFNNSFEIDTNEIDSKSASFKFLTRLARLTSPLL